VLLTKKCGGTSPFKLTIFPAEESVALVFKDCTEEEKLRGGYDELAGRFQVLFNSNTIGYYIARPDGTIYEANSEYLRLTGYSRDDLLSGKISWRKMTPPEYVANDNQKLSALLSTGSVA